MSSEKNQGCGYPCGYDCNGACFDEKKPQPVARYKEAGYDCGMDAAHDGGWVRYSDHKATIEALRAERDAARKNAREARKIISDTHKHAVRHVDCSSVHCMICDGGLFVCADCGAAEIETEQRVCPAAEARVAQLEKRIFEITEYDMDVCYAHTQLRALLSDGGRS